MKPASKLRWNLALSLGLIFASGITVTADDEPRVRSVPLTPEESLKLVELESSQAIELLVAEPLVVDPIEVAFDDAGRMWVVEMRDYPFLTDDAPQGKVAVLEDTDFDGVFDKRTDFADNLNMPTGLALWKDGALVTLAGELVFFRDTNNDLVADERQQWLVGFKEDNEQLRANHPRLGPDGWWYIACGLRGGDVSLGDHYPHSDSKPLAIGSRDIRFHAETGRLEAVTGPAQFGLSFDVVGSRFFCSNRNPAVQVVFEQADLSSNPLAGIIPSTRDVLPAGTESQVHPLIEAWTTSNLHAGQFTAACGVYLEHLQGLEHHVYACEPTGSLVKRERLHRGVATLEKSNSGPSEREWLASRDPWFRAVNITTDPAGGIVVVDMHRAVIEHPRWVPAELKNRPDERWGNQAGRILRVSREAEPLAATLKGLREQPLSSRSMEQLIELLGHPQAWFRETAFRLLLQSGQVTIISDLMASFRDRQRSDLSRLMTLRLAACIEGAIPPVVLDELDEQKNSEFFLIGVLRTLRAYQFPSRFAPRLHALALRPGPVQFEALLCLGRLPAGSPSHELIQAVVASSDPYAMIAAAKAYESAPVAFLLAWLRALELEQRSGLSDHLLSETASKLAAAIVAQAPEYSSTVLQHCAIQVVECHERDTLLASLHAASEFIGRDVEWDQDVEFWRRIRTLVEDREASIAVRQAAFSIIAYSPREDDHAFLRNYARMPDDVKLEEVSLTSWSRLQEPDIDEYLMQLLKSGSPQQKRIAVSLVRQSQSRLERLGQTLEDGGIKPKVIGAIHLKQLRDRARGAARKQLDSALAGMVNSDRARVIEQYKPVFDLASDPRRGKLVFQKHCATCHRVGEVGVDVGPDISDSRTKQPLQLLTSILDPNQVIDNNYFRFVVLTKDEVIVEGIIAEESADNVVLISQENKRTVVQRDEILQMQATGISMMPEGLESQIDAQGMADLIAFIKGWRYMDGSIPGQ